jgi:hypothetical protein
MRRIRAGTFPVFEVSELVPHNECLPCSTLSVRLVRFPESIEEIEFFFHFLKDYDIDFFSAFLGRDVMFLGNVMKTFVWTKS